jgi:hypothetical protein
MEAKDVFTLGHCQRACKAHDFASFTWQHLNFFQHHCFITARVPRVDCPDHGVKRVTVPWARVDSRFTLLFEQAALILAREMPVAAAARHGRHRWPRAGGRLMGPTSKTATRRSGDVPSDDRCQRSCRPPQPRT